MTVTDEDIPPGRAERYIAGDSLEIQVSVTERGGETPLDLSSAEFTFAVAFIQGRQPIIEKTTDDGISIVKPTEGLVSISVDGKETADLGKPSGQDFYYELTIKNAAGNVATVVSGQWEIYDDTAIL